MKRAKYEANSISRQKPWVAAGISRATWYRQRETAELCETETGPCEVKLLSAEDAPVSSEQAQAPSPSMQPNGPEPLASKPGLLPRSPPTVTEVRFWRSGDRIYYDDGTTLPGQVLPSVPADAEGWHSTHGKPAGLVTVETANLQPSRKNNQNPREAK